MMPDNIATAKPSDMTSRSDVSASIIQIKLEGARDLSGNNKPAGSTEPLRAAEGHLGSFVPRRGKKSFVRQPLLGYSTAMETVEDLNRKERPNLSNGTSEIRNAAVRRPIDERFQLLQKFQGQVIEIFEQEFKARLFDLTGDEDAYEFAMFSVDELDSSDTKLLKEGAIFYWYIGYSSGTRGRRRESFIRFSRSGRMTTEQYTASYDELGEMWSVLSAELSPERQ